ncbi:MAG: carboxypeptidase-like regulatory domain-containing protein, partial [Bacteroidales bacterium]|nr:carboxypeptidase-like regulatory domain-containing protein [Bacteroidales bacterium]
MKQTLWSTLLFLFLCTIAQAQTLAVKGNVVSKADGEPIVGAAVIENGNSSNGTVTDLDGNFTLTVPIGAELNFTSLGFKTATLKAVPEMKVELDVDSELLDDVIVTGYMSEKKASLTGSVAVVKMKDVADIPTGNIMTSLQGRVAGMNI